MRTSLAVLVLLVWTSLYGVPEACACAAAPPDGHVVTIVDEEALIVWEQEARRMHFVRRANFQTDAKDFGFLVPTPSKPELGEADDAVFSRLAKLLVPREVERTKYEVMWSLFGMFFTKSGRDDAKATATAGVEVLETKRVAGLDAAVLKVDDLEALGTWLVDHGYPFSPELKAWLKPYVAKNWIVTAFKIAGANPAKAEAGNGGAQRVGSKALRMTFQAQKPFYPYREPVRKPSEVDLPNRSLRVYYVTEGRAQAYLNDKPWNAKTLYAYPNGRDEVLALLGDTVPDSAVGADPWVTAFWDQTVTRDANHDIRFYTPKNRGRSVLPPTRTVNRTKTIPVLLEIWLVLGGLLFWVARRRHRRQRAA